MTIDKRTVPTARERSPAAAGNGQQRPLRRVAPGDVNYLNALGEKIFLDRYALKDMTKSDLQLGDLVVVCTDPETGQREIGSVGEIRGSEVVVVLEDGQTTVQPIEHVDVPLETHPDQMQERVARGIAAVESPAERPVWEERFRWLMEGWKFVPGGRILAAAGTNQNLTYYNCYVVPSPHDSRNGIIQTLEHMTEIMSRGGGVGINLSSLRPRYAYVRGVNGRSSGSVSWGSMYSFVTGLIEQGGSRRGALMLVLEVWHPDISEFVTSKRVMGRITNANISVGITDEFMAAVQADAEWPLVFPDTGDPAFEAEWTGDLAAWCAAGRPTVAYRTVRARELWDTIIESAWASAEPGLWFVERANKESNSAYYARLVCTNPCGEQPLPAWGVCNLGALHLGRFVQSGEVNWPDLGRAVRYAVRFLDNVIDVTPYFFEENERQQKLERRVGLGTMGLAEMMIRCGVRYGSPAGSEFCDRLYRFIATEAYLASSSIAAEKGSFPLFDAPRFLDSGFMRRMPEEVRQAVSEQGIRNVTLLTQAPTGSTGTMVDTSTGIEPFFSWTFYRHSRLGRYEQRVNVFAEWQAQNPGAPLPDYFVTAMDLTPEEHVGVQAVVQRWVDASISKTCNVPNSYTVEQTRALYELMYRLGCKGGTVYRDGSRDEQVLRRKEAEAKAEARTAPAAVRPRPRQLVGSTYRIATPVGKAYVTVNRNADHEPFEVFVNLGKAGSDLAADAEAIGRLISLVLRMPSPLTPEERVQQVVEELSGIGGSRAVGFGTERVRSLPDGVAHALREDLAQPENAPLPEQLSLFPGADLCPVCGHATFVREEGCQKCYSCGHSEC